MPKEIEGDCWARSEQFQVWLDQEAPLPLSPQWKAAPTDTLPAPHFSGLHLTGPVWDTDCSQGCGHMLPLARLDQVPRTPWVALNPQVDETTHPLPAPSLPERRCPALAGQPLNPAPWRTLGGGVGIWGSHLCSE